MVAADFPVVPPRVPIKIAETQVMEFRGVKLLPFDLGTDRRFRFIVQAAKKLILESGDPEATFKQPFAGVHVAVTAHKIVDGRACAEFIQKLLGPGVG